MVVKEVSGDGGQLSKGGGDLYLHERVAGAGRKKPHCLCRDCTQISLARARSEQSRVSLGAPQTDHQRKSSLYWERAGKHLMS